MTCQATAPTETSHGPALPVSSLVIEGLTAGYRTGPRRSHITVLHEVDLTVHTGELLAILGPSGCGKSTLLRAIAGLHPADAGRIELGGRLVTDQRHATPPERRGVGLVPQDSALFPHRSIAENIEFGLRSRRADRPRPNRAARRERVQELLDLVGLRGYEHRHPHELSGGERQRVALARALAPEPAIILLDEAFGALDASLRGQLRADVRAILRRSGATAILVTHDQDEALSISDRVAIMRDGRIVQVGAPSDLYSTPVDAWTARFLGECNVLPGDSDGTSARSSLGAIRTTLRPGPVQILIRPEQVQLSEPTPDGSEVRAEVTTVEYRGHSTYYRVFLPASGEIITVHALGGCRYPVGSVISVMLNGTAQVIAATDEPPGETNTA